MTTMSKLKRKKPAVENYKPEQESITKKTNESLCKVQESHGNKTHTGSSAGGAVSWWERSDLNDVERIWALTLKAFCPSLQTHQEECVPPLPPSSATLPQKAPAEKINDWKWNIPDADAIPDLPAPSFLHRRPVNDPSSRPPTTEDTEKPGPAVLTTQEIGESIQKDASWEMEYHGDRQAIDMCKPLKEPLSYEVGKEIKVKPTTPSVHRYGQNSSEGERSVSDSQVIAGGSGTGLEVKFGAGGSKSGIGTKQSAGGSGTGLKSKTRAGGSGTGLKTKTGAGGSGTGLKTKTGASETGLKTKTGAGGSKTGLGTLSGAGEPGSKLETKSGESGLVLETKPGAEGPKSELECCPMCLMPFPAGFSQMECDGHLAQCLSEMNEDIIW